jgi:hypothetical protein
MKRFLIAFFIISLSVSAIAQTSPCGFEKLFTIHPGMQKPFVIDTLNKSYKVSLVSDKIEKLPPYAKTGGDSIINEIITYKSDSSSCFWGSNSQLTLSFADGKLYKAYLSTQYPKSSFQQLTDNYNMLRNTIKPKWKFEKGIKISGGNTLGYGYDYSNTSKPSLKEDKVSLHYVDEKADSPYSGYYLLEVVWANLANTRMERSNY